MSGAYKYRPQYTQNTIGPSVGVVDRVEHWDAFLAQFEPLLGSTARWEGFSYIVKDQLARERISIIETGTLRNPGNWDGDGCSTKIWNWLAERRAAAVASVDNNLASCQQAQAECPLVRVDCNDSVVYLRSTRQVPTLLYLDSCDYPEPIELRKASMMHQAAELASIYARLPSGCLIASDDSLAKDHGKPGLTRRLLASFGIEPVVDSYIVVWRKP